MCLIFTALEYDDGIMEAYILAVAHAPREAAEALLEKYPLAGIARVQTQDEPVEGVLLDGLALPGSSQALLHLIERRAGVKGRHGRLNGISTPALKSFQGQVQGAESSSTLGAEQNNTSVAFGDRMVLKLFRRLQEGTNPDLEIGRYLTRKKFEHLPPVLGALEYRIQGEEPVTVGLLQAYVRNQGDAWQHALDNLSSF
ncbi:MAG: alpha-amylase, partial [Desulfobacterales bacterium]|nr:alpha-amylase [Desulfobacterales bacterium]